MRQELVTGPDDALQARMLRMLTGAWTTQSIGVAANLGLPDLIASGHSTEAELAKQTGAQPGNLRRLLRYLGGLGLVVRHEDQYQLTALGRTLVSSESGGLRDVAQLYSGLFYESFGYLGHTVRQGRNGFEHRFGLPPFQYLSENPDQARLFERAMAAGAPFFAAVPDRFDFGSADLVVDVGGGDGTFLRHLLAAVPHARGLLYDRPSVTARVGPFSERVTVVAGDLFQSVPEGGDVYVLSRILHDWDDSECGVILHNVRRAMGPDSALLIIERLIPEDGAMSLAVAWDLHMMVNNVGGRERTGAEYSGLLAAAGFTLAETAPLPLETNLLISYKTTKRSCHDQDPGTEGRTPGSP